jgi:hypothetical protein
LDSDFRVIPLLLIGGGLVFVIYAWAKGWFKGARRGAFTSQAVMHDWLNQDKRDAMEYVMDEDEEKDKKDALSGEGEESGDADAEESP